MYLFTSLNPPNHNNSAPEKYRQTVKRSRHPAHLLLLRLPCRMGIHPVQLRMRSAGMKLKKSDLELLLNRDFDVIEIRGEPGYEVD